MSLLITRKHILIGIVFLVGFVWVTGSYIANVRLQDTRTELEKQLSKQAELLAEIAEITSRNGADEVTSSIIVDCSIDERTEFDRLLATLDSGLSQSQLTTLERLFGRCGDFYAKRKAVMTARFEREVAVYQTYAEQLSALSATTKAADEVKLWEQLVVEEKRQSELFAQLVVYQDTIITLLLAGKSQTSQEIIGTLAQVKEVQQELQTAVTVASEIRTQLTLQQR